MSSDPKPASPNPSGEGSSEPTQPDAAPPGLLHPDPTGTLFLEIEDVVAVASPENIDHFFKDLREKLAALKGPRSAQAKKVLVALDRTEELFRHLLNVREQMSGGDPSKK